MQERSGLSTSPCSQDPGGLASSIDGHQLPVDQQEATIHTENESPDEEASGSRISFRENLWPEDRPYIVVADEMEQPETAGFELGPLKIPWVQQGLCDLVNDAYRQPSACATFRQFYFLSIAEGASCELINNDGESWSIIDVLAAHKRLVELLEMVAHREED